MQDLNTYGYWAICRPTGDDVFLRVFLRQAICCSLYGGWAPLGWYGFGWVMGPQVHLAVGWVGLEQLFARLGWVWVDGMDPWTTLARCARSYLK